MCPVFIKRIAFFFILRFLGKRMVHSGRNVTDLIIAKMKLKWYRIAGNVGSVSTVHAYKQARTQQVFGY